MNERLFVVTGVFRRENANTRRATKRLVAFEAFEAFVAKKSRIPLGLRGNTDRINDALWQPSEYNESRTGSIRWR